MRSVMERLRRPRTLIVLAVVALLLAGAGVYAYEEIYKPPGDVSNEDVEFDASDDEDTEAPRKAKPKDFLWPTYGLSNRRTRFLDAKIKPPFRRIWTLRGEGLLEYTPILAKGTLFHVRNSGTAEAYSAESGRFRWRRDVGALNASSPTYAKNRLFVSLLQPQRILSLSAKNGRTLWKRDLPSRSESSPVVVDGVVFFGSEDGTVYALKAKNGARKWTFQTADAVYGVSFANGRLFFGDKSGKVTAVNAENGKLIWQKQTSGASLGRGGIFYSTPAIAFGRVYIGNADRKVYSFSARDGSLAWTYTTGHYVYGGPAVADIPGPRADGVHRLLRLELLRHRRPQREAPLEPRLAGRDLRRSDHRGRRRLLLELRWGHDRPRGQDRQGPLPLARRPLHAGDLRRQADLPDRLRPGVRPRPEGVEGGPRPGQALQEAAAAAEAEGQGPEEAEELAMCGIGALLDPAGTLPPEVAERMMRALHHRGPDGNAIHRAGPATLVFARLAIIDVEGGDQPLHSEDGERSVIVNGEIYNHRHVRAELEQAGHRFATHSDCEVVVHAYEDDGPDMVRRLNGMFGLALWDAREQRLVAARDHFGVKPLYWWSDGRRVALASEIGALLATGLVEPAVDRVALDHYLACRFVPGTRTLFEGIHKLPAASLLVANADGGVDVRSFREPPGEPLRDSESDLADALADRFAEAVERQMMSDVPYGSFLSGGVDSAAIAAAMKRVGDRAPLTFTIGFPGHGGAFDEREYASETARIIGTDHRDTAQEQVDFLDDLARCVPRLEEPLGIPSAPALQQLSAFARQEVKVALSGQGADEPHGGYGRHQAASVLRALQRIPGALAGPLRAAASLPRGERARRAARLVGDMSDAQRLVRLVEITDEGTRQRLAGSAGAEAAAERGAMAEAVLADVPDRDLVERALYLDTHLFLPDHLLICGDKMSMSKSLEQRVPYLDVDLMRFVERIPGRTRVRWREGKRLHRRAMERLLPPEITSRPRHGFSSPYDRWLREALGEEVERRYSPGRPVADLVTPAEVGSLVRTHRAGRADHKWILYCLLELSEWHRAFIERADAAAA